MREPRTETERRAQIVRRLELAREQVAALQPGGSPDHALEVASAAVIESRTATLTCPHCRGHYRILEHTRPVPGIRQVEVECRHCSTPRTLWFRLVAKEPN